MVQAARANGVFLMEAMWSRFLPAYRILVDLLGEGRIGDPLVVEGDFGFRVPVEPDHRLFAPRSAAARRSTSGCTPYSSARSCSALPNASSPTASSARPRSTRWSPRSSTTRGTESA